MLIFENVSEGEFGGKTNSIQFVSLVILRRWLPHFISLSILLLTVQPSSADHDYYHGNYRDRPTLINESEVAASVIELLESRYPQAQVAVLEGSFIPMGISVPFESVQELISAEPLLCKLVRSKNAFFRLAQEPKNYVQEFERFELRSGENNDAQSCRPDNVALGIQADTATKLKLDLSPSPNAERWVLENVPPNVRNKINRVGVYENEHGEIARVHIYEVLTGFWRLFAGLQNPAPNGEYDTLTVVYNFAFRIGFVHY